MSPPALDHDLGFRQRVEHFAVEQLVAEPCVCRTCPSAGPGATAWYGEGYLGGSARAGRPDLVMRADFYVGERDLFGVGFSDNVVFQKQYYVRAILEPALRLRLYTGEEFQEDAAEEPTQGVAMREVDGGWEFDIGGTGFEATCRVELDAVPEEGRPQPLRP
jgi:hypothetical protein